MSGLPSIRALNCLPKMRSTRFTSHSGRLGSVSRHRDRRWKAVRALGANRLVGNAAELNGQVVRYDASKSQLTLRDPISPEEAFRCVLLPARRLSTRASPPRRRLCLRACWCGCCSRHANMRRSRVEILAEPGNSFTFAGRIVAVDLRSRVLALSNDSDQSVRELAIGSLDASSLGLPAGRCRCQYSGRVRWRPLQRSHGHARNPHDCLAESIVAFQSA